MFTKNFYSILACGVLGIEATKVGVTYYSGLKSGPSGDNLNSWKHEGTCLYNTTSAWAPLISRHKTDNSAGGVVFGDGSVPPTPDDYNLSGTEITTLSVSNVCVTNATKYEYAAITSTFTLTNTGANEVTIREVALFSHCWSTGSEWVVMVERTVLDAPVVIAPGGVGQVSYTIRIDMG